MPVFLAVGVSGVVVTACVPSLSSVLSSAQLLLTVVAIGWGVRRHRPPSAWPWLLLAGGPLSSLVGSAYSVVVGGRPPFPSFADAADVTLYAVFILGLVLWVGPAPGRPRWEGAVDAGIVTAGGLALSWTLIIDPVLRIEGLSATDEFGAVLYPVLDLLLLSVAARTVFLVGVRSVASLFIVAGLGCLLAADSLLLVLLAHGYQGGDHPLVMAGWSMTSVLIGAAGLHPSMARTRHHVDPGGDVVSKGRIRMYVLLTFLIPASVIGETLSADPDGVTAGRLLVPMLASAAMSALLLLRLSQLASVAHHRATDLDERTVALGAALRDQELLQGELRHQARHDPLTGLGNRTMLREVMAEPSTSGVRALMLLDLDGFKNVNDTLGHPAGDALLVEVSRRLHEHTPDGTTLVRLGGDEFAIVVTATTPDEVTAIAHAVLSAVGTPYRIDGTLQAVTTSIGVRMLSDPDGPLAPTDGMRDADLALYRAKGAGRNRIVVHRPLVSAAAAR